MLSYHYTIPRALMAWVVVDGGVVEDYYCGLLVYAGGRLASVITPGWWRPIWGAGRSGLLVLMVVLEARRVYSGSMGSVEGFNFMGGVVVLAIRLFGRSYLVYYVKAMTPLWVFLEESHRLLEAKE